MNKDFMAVFDITDTDSRKTWTQLITTLASLGFAVGCLTTGPLVVIGKKNCIHLANLVLIIGCSLTLVQVKEVVAVGRFLFGLAGGSFTVFVPSFINELTPNELKGPFGSATQILITLGILIANLLGIPMPECYKGEAVGDGDCKEGFNLYKPGFIGDDYWRLLFALPIALAVIQSLLLLFVFNYETPKFLKQQGREAELSTIMGKIYSSD